MLDAPMPQREVRPRFRAAIGTVALGLWIGALGCAATALQLLGPQSDSLEAQILELPRP